jgi:Ca2+-binding EF-hand superfamily protein
VAKSNELTYVRTLFRMADRDGDDKLTEKEVTAFAELMGQAPMAGASLTFYTQVQGIFEVIDRDRDGRLSRRELVGAWEALEPYDANHDGKVGRAELPRQYQIVAGRTMNGASFASPFMGAPTAQGAPKAGGPAWFVKMDRNGDGDISSREFLGTREAFKKLDTNGDGLISREEAEAAK